MGEIVGYARVSSVGQKLDVQEAALKKAGCTRFFQEKKSGVDADRPQLQEVLRYMREGDTFVVTKMDRLARNARDLLNIAKELDDKRVTFRILDQAIDTSTPAGKLMLQMLAAFAEFETNLRKERQMEGIAKAKADGKVFGRRPVDDATVEEIRRLRAGGMSFPKIAKELGLSVGVVHKHDKDAA